MNAQKPWLKYYGAIPASLKYPRVSLYETLMGAVAQHADKVAWDFFGKTQTYAELSHAVHQCAEGLAALGLEAGDRITIAMPTCPQAIIAFYAANFLGAVANLIHPLASPKDIEYYLKISQSRIAVTLDAHLEKFRAVRSQTPLKTLIIVKISDYLSVSQKLKLALMKRHKQDQPCLEQWVVTWSSLFGPGHPKCVPIPANTEALAAILYSGGSTNRPKGVMLSNRNLIATGMMAATWGKLSSGDTILATLPLFHGFGLGVCVNAALMSGAASILVPQYSSKILAHLIRTKQPSLIIGTPGLFHALTQNFKFRRSDLSRLKAAFCGADTLPNSVRERFEEIVRRAGGNVTIQAGFGLTEAVTAVMGNPIDAPRDRSIGIPFPDMDAKIVRPGTDESLACGLKGELCLHGPTIMLGYLNRPAETAQTLKIHRDGKLWLHTGDLCSMDSDGFFYFHLRLKRIIKSSGLSISPVQVENRLLRHPDVLETCVIGVPDLSLVEKVKAFVVLKEMQKAGSDMAHALTEYCRKELVQESCPQEIEFRPDIPKTLLGKIAYHELWQQEIKKLRREGRYAGEAS